MARLLVMVLLLVIVNAVSGSLWKGKPKDDNKSVNDHGTANDSKKMCSCKCKEKEEKENWPKGNKNLEENNKWHKSDKYDEIENWSEKSGENNNNKLDKKYANSGKMYNSGERRDKNNERNYKKEPKQFGLRKMNNDGEKENGRGRIH